MSAQTVLVPYRLRTVRTGVAATFLVMVGLVVYPFVPATPPIDTGPYIATMGVAIAGVIGIALLPWRRLFERGWGMWFLYTWSVLDMLLITAGVAFSGGAESEFFWVYVLTAFFMAASYPPRAQLALLVFTYACYFSLLIVTDEPLVAGDLVLRASVLGVLTFMTSFLSSELLRQTEAHARAHEDAERRAGLLGSVAAAARTMSTLDSDKILSIIVDVTTDLGFEAAMLCVLDDRGERYSVPHARGVPEGYTARSYASTEGVNALVLESRETVVVEDYSTHPQGVRELQEAGFRGGIATPVWVQGEIAAILACGTKRERTFGSDVVEATELLAAQAGRALENARLFEEERRTVERLAELDRLKRDFLSNVSHELRTPLTVISGMGATLKENWDRLTDDRRQDFIRRINSNADALDEVIATLLDFSRLEAGGMELEREDISLKAFLDPIAARLGPLFESALTYEAEDPLIVNADPKLLERVVENLLSNAAKHTPDGTPVRLEARREGEYAVVAVSDEGPGIPPEEMEHLGERFFRGGDTNTRPSRGTGLGLAFVGEVLTLHGSRLRIDSEVGEGSRFSFRLPLVTTSGPDRSTDRLSGRA